MKDALKIGLGIVIGLLGLAACALCALLIFAGGGIALLGAIPTSTPVSRVGDVPYRSPIVGTATEAPQSPGTSITYDGLTVTLVSYEFSQGYRTQYDYDETPAEGAKYLWILILVENVGANAAYTPSASDFAVVYKAEQTDSDGFLFADRPGYEAFEAGELFPAVSRRGWIRFTIPMAAQPEDLTIAFKPFDLFSQDYYTWTLQP